MRIYYVGESRSRTLHVTTALGVDDEIWPLLAERIQDWTWVIEADYHVPSKARLRWEGLLTGTGNPFNLSRRRCWPNPERGAGVFIHVLRFLEHFRRNDCCNVGHTNP